MAKLCASPLDVITRLKFSRDNYTHPYTNFEIYGASENDPIVKRDVNEQVPKITLHVIPAASSASVITKASYRPQEYQNNISIILSILLEDIRGQEAVEYAYFFKGFIWRSLNSWPTEDTPGCAQFDLAGDTSLGVEGQAIYFHEYNYSQIVRLDKTNWTDMTEQDWASLPWFERSENEMTFENTDGSENTIITRTEVDPAGDGPIFP